jgi:cell division protein FtsL
MTNSRVAVLLLAVLALMITGIMVETYWDRETIAGRHTQELRRQQRRRRRLRRPLR